jgi:surface protein
MAGFYSVAQEKLNYELWLDQLYVVRERGVIEGGEKELSISLDLIPYGIHSVSFRVQGSDGTWGAPATKYFFHPEETSAKNFECWIDGMQALAQKGTLDGPEKLFELPLAMIPAGFHSVSFRVQDNKGNWGAPATRYFMFAPSGTEVAGYEYWLDDLHGLAYSGEIGPEGMEAQIDLSIIPVGFHRVNCRLKDSNGNWGPTAVRYFFNGEEVQFNYDGRYLSMATTVPDADINYVKGTPEEAADGEVTVYDGTPIDVEGLGAFTAWTGERGSLICTDESVFDVPGYGLEDKAVLAVPGVLASCYEWNEGRIPDARFSVEGSLDASDYEWINTQRKLLHLDLTDVTSDSIPAGAFHSTLRSLVLPSGIKNISGNIFRRKQSNLCALKWTSTNPIPPGMLDSLINRNLLLYVDDASLATNVYPRSLYPIHLVAAGVSIGIDFNVQDWFYCPEEFIAKQVVLDRYFYKETGINGECAGWETILIPFDVQNVVDNRYDDELFLDMIPFGVNPEEERLRYWLYAPTISGWERATAIKANEPYLIAMPKNELYYGPFNVGGFVSFSASNAVVHATPDEIIRDFTGGRKLVGNYDGFDMSPEEYEKVLGINPDTVEIDGKSYRPGSVFVPCHNYYGYHIIVHPFEAYMLAEGEQALRKMEIFTSSEVEDVLADMEMEVWTENGGIRIKAGFTARVDVFDMTGRRVAVADVKAGEVCRVDGLAPGIYIAANRKVLLK